MSKAFNRVEWPFLANVMRRLGFCQQWVDFVMKYIKSASFSFFKNGVPKGHVIPSRGIWQGDPSLHISFYSYRKVSLVYLEERWHETNCMGIHCAISHQLHSTYYLQTIQWFFVVRRQPKRRLFETYCANTKGHPGRWSSSRKQMWFSVRKSLPHVASKLHYA